MNNAHEPVIQADPIDLIALFTTLPTEDPMPLNCAWCMVEQLQPLGTGSHGICKEHAAQFRSRRVRPILPQGGKQ